LQTRGNFVWARLGVIDIDTDLGCSQDNLEVFLQEGRSYANISPLCQDRLRDLLDLMGQFFTLSVRQGKFVDPIPSVEQEVFYPPIVSCR
jgi:hypothetical protein